MDYLLLLLFFFFKKKKEHDHNVCWLFIVWIRALAKRLYKRISSFRQRMDAILYVYFRNSTAELHRMVLTGRNR